MPWLIYFPYQPDYWNCTDWQFQWTYHFSININQIELFSAILLTHHPCCHNGIFFEPSLWRWHNSWQPLCDYYYYSTETRQWCPPSASCLHHTSGCLVCFVWRGVSSCSYLRDTALLGSMCSLLQSSPPTHPRVKDLAPLYTARYSRKAWFFALGVSF